MEIISIIGIFYLLGIFISMMIGLLISASDLDWKYAEGEYIFIYPILLYLIPRDLIINFNNYLNTNNLKQMNFKVLGKAMGFMFLPTLGVLLMLLIGFFDPIVMWNWIKSDSGWAIFTRIIIFCLEIGLVTYLYFDYLKKEIKTNSNGISVTEEEVYYNTDMYMLWSDRRDNFSFKFYKTRTEDPNILIIERKSK